MFYPLYIYFIFLTALPSFAWTVRIVGFMILAFLLLANAFLRVRIPPSGATRSIISKGAFANPAYTLYIAGGFFALLGFYVPLTFFGVKGLEDGLSANMAFYLVPIANAASLVGRLGAGLLADKVRFDSPTYNALIAEMIICEGWTLECPYYYVLCSWNSVVCMAVCS